MCLLKKKRVDTLYASKVNFIIHKKKGCGNVHIKGRLRDIITTCNTGPQVDSVLGQGCDRML